MIQNLNKIIYLTLAIALALSACASTQIPFPESTKESQTPTVIPVRSQAEQEAWSEDLDYFMERLRKIHPDPFLSHI